MKSCLTVREKDYLPEISSWIDTGKDTRDAVRELSELPPSRELELPPTAGVPARRLMAKLGLDIPEVTGAIYPHVLCNSY